MPVLEALANAVERVVQVALFLHEALVIAKGDVADRVEGIEDRPLGDVDFRARVGEALYEEVDVVVDMGFVVEDGGRGECGDDLSLQGRDTCFVSDRCPRSDNLAINGLVSHFV